MKPLFIPDPRIVWPNLSGHAEFVYLEEYLKYFRGNLLCGNPNAMELIQQRLEQGFKHVDWFYLSRNPRVTTLLKKPDVFRICEKNLDWNYLSYQPEAVPLLAKHLDKIYWYSLSSNPQAVPLLEQHMNKISWSSLSRNPGAMDILYKNQDKISWDGLCWNPNPDAIPLLTTRVETEMMDWDGISSNPNALPLLEKYPEKINWKYASKNAALLTFFEKNPDKVVWNYMCYNDKLTSETIEFLEKHVDKLCPHCWYSLSKYPVAIPLLEKYPEHINWHKLSCNPNATHLLEQHPEKIDWDQLSLNPGAMHLLFHLDTERMKINNQSFHDELVEYVLHPDRMMRLCRQYDMDLRSYVKIY